MSVLFPPVQGLSGSSLTVRCGTPLWGCEMLGINSADPLHPVKLFATNLVFMLNLCIRYSLKDEIGACAVTFLLVIQSALFLCDL